MKTKINEDSLQIEHIYSASVEAVFNCFIDVDIAKKWMAPGKMKCAVLTMDVIPGGKYQITMENEEGEQHTATGEYTEVIANKRLAYTWKWDSADSPETFVEIDFHEEESGCKLVFNHRGFATADAAKSHSEGWSSILDKLASQLK